MLAYNFYNIQSFRIKHGRAEEKQRSGKGLGTGGFLT
jgi:hypothetical protein